MAVEKYDGGILEIASKKEDSGNSSLVLHPNASNAACGLADLSISMHIIVNISLYSSLK